MTACISRTTVSNKNRILLHKSKDYSSLQPWPFAHFLGQYYIYFILVYVVMFPCIPWSPAELTIYIFNIGMPHLGNISFFTIYADIISNMKRPLWWALVVTADSSIQTCTVHCGPFISQIAPYSSVTCKKVHAQTYYQRYKTVLAMLDKIWPSIHIVL